MKAEHISIALSLEQIPNVGVSTANLIREAGVASPIELKDIDPVWLFDKICQLTRKSHDRRLLFILYSATEFAKGHAPKHWSEYRAEIGAISGQSTKKGSSE